jgi:O-antigen/teichoic acid export membrane protein
MLVSRWVIDLLGMHANGIFSTAWKVCSLYFGALYASASGYYLPTLSSTNNNGELCDKVNEAVTLYLYVLTPIVIALIVGGNELITILFSENFTLAATLLLCFLPGDLFRIIAETIGLSFLAKRKIFIYTTSYCIWALLFLFLSWEFIKIHGLLGVGYAYVISQLINAIVALSFAKWAFGYALSDSSIRACSLGFLSSFLAVLIVMANVAWWIQYSTGLCILLFWFLLNWRDAQFRGLVNAVVLKIKRRHA